eukprot:6558163-Prymnesium_polylepis.1
MAVPEAGAGPMAVAKAVLGRGARAAAVAPPMAGAERAAGARAGRGSNMAVRPAPLRIRAPLGVPTYPARARLTRLTRHTPSALDSRARASRLTPVQPVRRV